MGKKRGNDPRSWPVYTEKGEIRTVSALDSPHSIPHADGAIRICDKLEKAGYNKELSNDHCLEALEEHPFVKQNRHLTDRSESKRTTLPSSN